VASTPVVIAAVGLKAADIVAAKRADSMPPAEKQVASTPPMRA
jgi:hypothetical protein